MKLKRAVYYLSIVGAAMAFCRGEDAAWAFGAKQLKAKHVDVTLRFTRVPNPARPHEYTYRAIESEVSAQYSALFWGKGQLYYTKKRAVRETMAYNAGPLDPWLFRTALAPDEKGIAAAEFMIRAEGDHLAVRASFAFAPGQRAAPCWGGQTVGIARGSWQDFYNGGELVLHEELETTPGFSSFGLTDRLGDALAMDLLKSSGIEGVTTVPSEDLTEEMTCAEPPALIMRQESAVLQLRNCTMRHRIHLAAGRM